MGWHRSTRVWEPQSILSSHGIPLLSGWHTRRDSDVLSGAAVLRVQGACKKHLQFLLRKGIPKASPSGPGWGPGNWLLAQVCLEPGWGERMVMPDHPRRTLSQSRAVFQIRTEGSMFGVAAEPELHLIISNFYYHPPNVGSLRWPCWRCLALTLLSLLAQRTTETAVTWATCCSSSPACCTEAHHRHVRETQHREYRPPTPMLCACPQAPSAYLLAHGLVCRWSTKVWFMWSAFAGALS